MIKDMDDRKNREMTLRDRQREQSSLKRFRASEDTVPYDEPETDDIHTDDPYFVDAPKEIEVATDEDTVKR